jgi:hypothetical protein
MGLTDDPHAIILTREHAPRVLPFGWQEHQEYGESIRVYQHQRLGLRVLFSACVELDGKRWIHMSVSRTDRRLPTWDNLRLAKDLFIGADKLAIQVLPREKDYVNIHAGVLHLWHCLDGDPTPDFTMGMGSI